MGYQLDPWQHIVAFNFSRPADYGVLYVRFVPEYTKFHGQAAMINPDRTEVQDNVHIHSVGGTVFAILPHGTDNRADPEGGFGKAPPGVLLPLLLPTQEQLDTVYLWHVGGTETWGLADQLIVNFKKLVADFPGKDRFEVQLFGHTYGRSPDFPAGENSQDNPIVPYVGLKAYAGEGSFAFDEESGEVVFTGQENKAKGLADVKKLLGLVPITVYGGGIEQALRFNWEVPYKAPKSADLGGSYASVS